MNKSYLVRGGAIVAIIACAYVLIFRVYIDSDLTKSVESTFSEVGTDNAELIDSDDELLDEPLQNNEQDQEELDYSNDENFVMKPNQFNKEAWENAGSSLQERIKNTVDISKLPKSEKPYYVIDRMKNVEVLRQQMRDIRQEGLFNNSAGAWATLKFVPVMNDEEVLGIKINDFEAAEFLEENGLEYGDIITHVNGEKVNSPETAYEGINTIGEDQSLNLTIDRGGEPVSVIVNKKQANSKN